MINYPNILNIKNNCYIFLLIIVAIFSLQVSNLEAFEYKKFTLNNGLEVYLLKNTNPIVTQIISYGVGSVEESSSKEGMAHLLEHMMFLGSNKYSKDYFSSKLKEIGATYNAYTYFDITLYHFNVPVIYLEEVMKIESDRMKWLVLDEKTIDNEKKVINEERNMVYNKPYNAFFSLAYMHLFPTTNYGRSVIGFEENFNNISKADLQNFYTKWYNPNNAKLFISGNIDFVKVEKLVKKHYESIFNSNVVYARSAYKEVSYLYDLEMVYKDSRINENILMISFLAPSIISDTSSNKITSHSLILLSSILGAKSGDMYKNFVIKRKLAKEISIEYDYALIGNTTFNIIALPADGVNIDLLKKELLTYLKSLDNAKMNSKLLYYYAKLFKNNREYLKEDNEEYVFNMARLINSGLSIEDYYAMQTNIANIKSINFNREVKKLFLGNHIVSKAIK